MNTLAEPETVPIRVAWIVAVWLGFAAVDASRWVLGMYASGMHHDWPKLFLLYLLAWLPWPLATRYIMRFGQRALLERLSIRTVIAPLAGLVMMLVISSAWFACLDVLLEPWLAPGPPDAFIVKLGYAIYIWSVPTVILYVFIVALGEWLRSRETLALQRLETARLNEQLAVAELSALRQQIEPHFLFNTLNGVVGLMREHKIEPAIGAIVDLSELLRGTLQRSNRPFVTLLEELELLGRYLDIQKTRCGERLQIDIDVPGALSSVRVPAPLLQPLVENAIKHGIERREQGGWIRIRAERSGDTLHLRVYNDGPGLAHARVRAGSGIGISNLRKRLGILFGTQFSLELNDRETGVEVCVSLPIERGSNP
jgi:hypothetical protein